jgi:hypothetical protein
MDQKYKEWLELRKKSANEEGEQLCYCGHTKRCDCGDPDLLTFTESVSRGDIVPDDPNNGWKTVQPSGNFTIG